jgi:tRNA/rRNA methyltransferase
MGLERVRIVLVEPAGARNVGSIARVMANMGLKQLFLVSPRCDWQGEESQHMAVRGADVLAATKVVGNLKSALVGCTRVVATTHRQDLPVAPQSPEVALSWLQEVEGSIAIVFGREDRGLDNQELSLAQRYLRIPVDDAYTSLNLAQAVGICAYELGRCPATTSEPAPEKLATIDGLDRYLNQLEELLLEVGYLLPHTAPHRMAKLRHLYNRSNLTEQELALLWGTSSQLRWALKTAKEKS